MNIAFVHHHLRPGGVSRVIAEQINSLGDKVQTLVVSGEKPSHTVSFPFIVVPHLAYDRDRNDNMSPLDAAKLILKGIKSIWKDGADLFHFHNPTLGKNRDYLTVIKTLLSMGSKVLLQIHDFAEDGRPFNYSNEKYPENCHYAVLNKRDYTILLRSGLKNEGLHLIPNPVKPLEVQDSFEQDSFEQDAFKQERDIVLYPVRAIRRKNIGEAVLLSLFLRDNEKVGVTLEPTSELDRRSYSDWVNFANSERLNIIFRLGIDHRFEKVLGRARCMLTTSIKEGFGFSFLEPWTAGRMLFGRILSDICSDFIEKGIRLEHLYKKISIPLSFIDKKLLYSKWQECYAQKMKQYGITVKPTDIEKSFYSLIDDNCIDYGYLSEGLQRQVIFQVQKNRKNYKKILDLNPFLEKISSFEGWEQLVENNRKIVTEEYSLTKNRVTLMNVYERVLNVEVKHSIDKRVVLDAFNTPEKNFLLLCDSAYG